MTLLVDAAFWQEMGYPERADNWTINRISNILHHRAGAGKATTIRRPSTLNIMKTYTKAERAAIYAAALPSKMSTPGATGPSKPLKPAPGGAMSITQF